jgi:hypothetical protein
MLKDLVGDIVRGVGYELEGHWLREALTRELSRAKDDDDRKLDYEAIIMAALPLDIEAPGFESEEGYPASSASCVALHLAGLFCSSTLGPAAGGFRDGFIAVFDLNLEPTPLYAADFDGESAGRLWPQLILRNGSPDALRALLDQWLEVSQLAVVDPNAPERAALRAKAQDFAQKYPGVVLLKNLHQRLELLTAPQESELEKLPDEVSKLYDGLMVIAPALLAAAGLPPLGSDPHAGQAALAKIPSLATQHAHAEACQLGQMLALWVAGERAAALASAERLASPPARPLSRRWAARVQGAA